jgi:hypothetical protein
VGTCFFTVRLMTASALRGGAWTGAGAIGAASPAAAAIFCM